MLKHGLSEVGGEWWEGVGGSDSAYSYIDWPPLTAFSATAKRKTTSRRPVLFPGCWQTSSSVDEHNLLIVNALY